MKAGLYWWVAPLYVCWRVGWANRLPIMDCDEVYNYWEPLHFMLYGSGMQTWEYAHQFGLRTYAYLFPLKVVASLVQRFAPVAVVPWKLLTDHGVVGERIACFVILRAFLAGLMAVAEIRFLRDLQEASGKQSLLAQAAGILMLFATGMSHMAGALLPSTAVTLFWFLASSAFLQQQHLQFCLWAVLSTLCVGWPFGVLVFVPSALVILVREYQNGYMTFVFRLLTKTAVMAFVVQAAVMGIDYHYYGKWISPTLNIFWYNTSQGGDELYGVEPASYYIKNLLLNFNCAFPLAILFAPAFLVKLVVRSFKKSSSERTASNDSAVLTLVASFFVWVAVVGPRPHKEERFLFPAYPAICLAAAWSVVESISFVTTAFRIRLRQPTAMAVLSLLLLPFVVLSLLRTMALSKFYSAPLQVYARLQQEEVGNEQRLVCTCGEWYRFPSSFYLPPGFRLGFRPSSFEGQLPRPFTEYASREESVLLTDFNDQNTMSPGSLIASEEECDYMVDLWDSADCRENDSHWTPIHEAPFLDAERTSTLHRIIYLPIIHELAEQQGDVRYMDYTLFRRSFQDDSAGRSS